MYKVIIADDMEMIRTGLFYRNDWNDMGYEVTALLEDGSEVLEYLEKERADVLLADICMYSVSGLEVAKVIDEKYPWMKVVLISGYQDFEFAQDAIRCRVYDYLLKPIDYDRLRKIFAKIKIELDNRKRVDLMYQCFHEKEYGQTLYLLQQLSDGTELAEKTWRDYTELWHAFQKSSSRVHGYVGEEMLELLEKEIQKRDPQIAEELDKQLLNLDGNAGDNLLSLLKWLEKKLEEKQYIEASKKDVEIIRACRYIQEHLDENVSLENAAQYVHLSTRQFTRRFYQQMGETFKEYTNRIRMEKAVRLQKQGIPMEKIYYMVGYKDFKYFQQLFKKYTGDMLQK